MKELNDTLLSRFDYERGKLIGDIRSARDDLSNAAQQLEKFDIEEALSKGRLTIPINGLGVLQSRGPMIDNRAGSLESLYRSIKDLRDLNELV